MVKSSLNRIFIFFFCYLFSSNLFAQHPKFDRLEQLYSQQLYKMVYRKSKKMISDDRYSFSKIPSYYYSLSTIQRAHNLKWNRKHQKEVHSALQYLIKLREDNKGKLILESHQLEIYELKISINGMLTNLKLLNREIEYQKISQLLEELTKDLILVENEEIQTRNRPQKVTKKVDKLISKAEAQLGIKYIYGGSDPSGFDCSGFTKYVFASIGSEIPRIAKDQYNFSKKIKQKDAKIGDLVFFTHGGPIAHVGLIYNIEEAEIIMIHASSSKGIQIISLTKSRYWNSRIFGYGKIL